MGAESSQSISTDLLKYIKDQKQEFFKVSICRPLHQTSQQHQGALLRYMPSSHSQTGIVMHADKQVVCCQLGINPSILVDNMPTYITSPVGARHLPVHCIRGRPA
jgi:hypothetical protein